MNSSSNFSKKKNKNKRKGDSNSYQYRKALLDELTEVLIADEDEDTNKQDPVEVERKLYPSFREKNVSNFKDGEEEEEEDYLHSKRESHLDGLNHTTFLRNSNGEETSQSAMNRDTSEHYNNKYSNTSLEEEFFFDGAPSSSSSSSPELRHSPTPPLSTAFQTQKRKEKTNHKDTRQLRDTLLHAFSAAPLIEEKDSILIQFIDNCLANNIPDEIIAEQLSFMCYSMKEIIELNLQLEERKLDKHHYHHHHYYNKNNNNNNNNNNNKRHVEKEKVNKTHSTTLIERERGKGIPQAQSPSRTAPSPPERNHSPNRTVSFGAPLRSVIEEDKEFLAKYGQRGKMQPPTTRRSSLPTRPPPPPPPRHHNHGHGSLHSPTRKCELCDLLREQEAEGNSPVGRDGPFIEDPSVGTARRGYMLPTHNSVFKRKSFDPETFFSARETSPPPPPRESGRTKHIINNNRDNNNTNNNKYSSTESPRYYRSYFQENDDADNKDYRDLYSTSQKEPAPSYSFVSSFSRKYDYNSDNKSNRSFNNYNNQNKESTSAVSSFRYGNRKDDTDLNRIHHGFHDTPVQQQKTTPMVVKPTRSSLLRAAITAAEKAQSTSSTNNNNNITTNITTGRIESKGAPPSQWRRRDPSIANARVIQREEKNKEEGEGFPSRSAPLLRQDTLLHEEKLATTATLPPRAPSVVSSVPSSSLLPSQELLSSTVHPSSRPTPRTADIATTTATLQHSSHRPRYPPPSPPPVMLTSPVFQLFLEQSQRKIRETEEVLLRSVLSSSSPSPAKRPVKQQTSTASPETTRHHPSLLSFTGVHSKQKGKKGKSSRTQRKTDSETDSEDSSSYSSSDG